MAYDRDRENSYGGFQYRWNYDEYQKSLQRKRKKSAARGMRAFCLTTVFVFLLCTASLLVVLSASFLRGMLYSLPTHPSDGTDITQPMNGDAASAASTVLPQTQNALTEPQQNETIPSPERDDSVTPPDAVNNGDIADVPAVPPEEPTDDLKLQEVVREETSSSDDTDIFAEMTVSEIAEAYSASTVTIQCKNTEFRSIGSGFFLSDDGYIVTNHHVIGRYDAYHVLLHDGTTYDAELVFSRPEQDIVLLKIDAPKQPVVSVGSSADAVIGDQVVAIGTPGSVTFAGTVTYGYISGLDRNIEITGSDESVIGYMNMIQITAVINPGNSGGPLFNRFGEVIAINTMKMTGEGFEGMGFAIPIDDVYPLLVEQMDAHRAKNAPVTEDMGSADTENSTVSDETQNDPPETEEPPADERPYAELGIRGETVTEKESVLYKMPIGVIIRHVEAGSYAESNGLQIGDIILSVNGSPITDVASLQAWTQTVRVGDTAEITIFRADTEMTVTVTFGSVPQEQTNEAEDDTEELPLPDAA